MKCIIRFQFSTAVNLYKILGVPQKSSQDDIKKAYLELAKEHHPDVNKNSSDKFKDISNAYSVLKDPLKRNVYDQTLEMDTNYQKPQQSNYHQGQKQDPYEQQAYQREYHKQNEYPSIYWFLMGGMFMYSLYLGVVYNSKHQFTDPPRDQLQQNLDDEIKKLTKKLQTEGPFTHEELAVIFEAIQKIQNQQTSTKLQSSSQLNNSQIISSIRRNNVFMSNENIYQSPQVLINRKKALAEEMKTKQFKIEYETWQTVRSGEVSRLTRKTQTQTRKKAKRDDVILEDYAKQHHFKLIKKEREAHAPIALTLDHFEDTYM